MDDINTRIQELEKQREKLRQESIEMMLSKLLQKYDFTPSHKAQIFDKLHDQLMEDMKYLAEHGYFPKDDKYWVWETAVSKLLGDQAFEFIRRMQK